MTDGALLNIAHHNKEFIAFAHKLADAADAVTLTWFRKPALSIADKAASDAQPFDPVTQADQAAEAAMRALIAQSYPAHAIVGEEFGRDAALQNAAYQWLLDPIDGTRAFLMGSPLWGTLIGLMAHGAPAIGLMSQPFTGERFWGDGTRAWYARGGDTAPIRTRGSVALSHAILTSTAPELFAPGHETAAFGRLERTVRLRRFGGDCYGYALLAAGHVDLVVEAGLKPYDIMPLIPIITGAGGVVTDWRGAPLATEASHGEGLRVLAAGCTSLHAQALAIINGA